jgi:hypothetical protein
VTIHGKRTLLFGLACLLALLVGLWLVDPVARGQVYGFFGGAVAGLMAAVAGKASVDALAQGGGVQGAKAALMTDAKPGGTP